MAMRPDFGAVLPRVADNRFAGHPVALWAFWALTLMTLWRSQHHILAPDGGAQSIATIPLDSFGAPAAQTVVFVFALWGVSQLLLGLVMAVVALRYRALIPLMLLIVTAEYALRAALPLFKAPVVTEGTAPGSLANLVFLALGPVLFLASIWRGRG